MQAAGSNRNGSKRYRCAPEGVYCFGVSMNLDGTLPDDDSLLKPYSSPRFAPTIEPGTKRFIITAAQNATPVHEDFWEALKVAAKHLKAQLLVIPLRYKNPTSVFEGSRENEETWVDEVQPYLFNQRKKINANLVLVGDVKIQPTASHPLTGFEGLTGAESCILGHTKLQFKTVPVPAGRFPKILTTTGACTMANYTDSRAGKTGAFHHTLGACLVEVSGRKFFLRQLNGGKDGSFTDLDKVYSRDGVTSAPPALGLVMGDTHVRFVDPNVEKATFGKGGIVSLLRPRNLVWHDLCDGYTHNPHHLGNPFIGVAKTTARAGEVEGEVREAISYVDKHTPKGCESVVVGDANHNDFLNRWVKRADWKTDPLNARFYLETALEMVKSTKMTPSGTEHGDAFSYWFKKLSKNSSARCLGVDESFTLAGIECGMHGHQGPNGSRGSIKNLGRIGAKSVIGHSHSPGINEGCYQAGTSTRLRLEYTHGPSSWLNTHVAIYASGKRALITIIDGEWKL